MSLPAWQIRLNQILQSWKGTPWGAGQCCRGKGVDCRYFVMGVLDELYGITDPLPPRLSQDTSKNNRTLAIAAVTQISKRYPCTMNSGDELEPGDVIIARSPDAAAETLQHALIIGVGEPVPIWNASSGGVGYTSLSNWIVTASFKTLNKETWASQQ